MEPIRMGLRAFAGRADRYVLEVEVIVYPEELMAQRIKELEAENARLREVSGWFISDSRFVVQVGGNPNVVPQMIEATRQALGASHD